MAEFGILGPVQVVRDGRVLELGGPRRRAVLALLLVAGGLVVPAEQLAEELWGGHPPPGAAGTLCAHVSRLRTLLSPDAALVAEGGGYRLALPAAGELDAARFERLAGTAREALARPRERYRLPAFRASRRRRPALDGGATAGAGNVGTGGVRVPGGPPGLQNRWTAFRVVGGFDSRPPPLVW